MLGDYPPPFWGNPSEDELFDYCHYILVISKMETEIPIIALAYIERLLLKTGVLLNFSNWRKLVLATMILGSKVSVRSDVLRSGMMIVLRIITSLKFFLNFH